MPFWGQCTSEKAARAAPDFFTATLHLRVVSWSNRVTGCHQEERDASSASQSLEHILTKYSVSGKRVLSFCKLRLQSDTDAMRRCVRFGTGLESRGAGAVWMRRENLHKSKSIPEVFSSAWRLLSQVRSGNFMFYKRFTTSRVWKSRSSVSFILSSIVSCWNH